MRSAKSSTMILHAFVRNYSAWYGVYVFNPEICVFTYFPANPRFSTSQITLKRDVPDCDPASQQFDAPGVIDESTLIEDCQAYNPSSLCAQLTCEMYRGFIVGTVRCCC